MPKWFIRIVAALLIPCLLADVRLAAAARAEPLVAHHRMDLSSPYFSASTLSFSGAARFLGKRTSAAAAVFTLSALAAVAYPHAPENLSALAAVAYPHAPENLSALTSIGSWGLSSALLVLGMAAGAPRIKRPQTSAPLIYRVTDTIYAVATVLIPNNLINWAVRTQNALSQYPSPSNARERLLLQPSEALYTGQYMRYPGGATQENKAAYAEFLSFYSSFLGLFKIPFLTAHQKAFHQLYTTDNLILISLERLAGLPQASRVDIEHEKTHRAFLSTAPEIQTKLNALAAGIARVEPEAPVIQMIQEHYPPEIQNEEIIVNLAGLTSAELKSYFKALRVTVSDFGINPKEALELLIALQQAALLTPYERERVHAAHLELSTRHEFSRAWPPGTEGNPGGTDPNPGSILGPSYASIAHKLEWAFGFPFLIVFAKPILHMAAKTYVWFNPGETDLLTAADERADMSRASRWTGGVSSAFLAGSLSLHFLSPFAGSFLFACASLHVWFMSAGLIFSSEHPPTRFTAQNLKDWLPNLGRQISYSEIAKILQARRQMERLVLTFVGMFIAIPSTGAFITAMYLALGPRHRPSDLVVIPLMLLVGKWANEFLHWGYNRMSGIPASMLDGASDKHTEAPTPTTVDDASLSPEDVALRLKRLFTHPEFARYAADKEMKYETPRTDVRHHLQDMKAGLDHPEDVDLLIAILNLPASWWNENGRAAARTAARLLSATDASYRKWVTNLSTKVWTTAVRMALVERVTGSLDGKVFTRTFNDRDPDGPKRRRNPVLEVMDWTHEAARDILHRGNRVRFATGAGSNNPNIKQQSGHTFPDPLNQTDTPFTDPHLMKPDAYGRALHNLILSPEVTPESWARRRAIKRIGPLAEKMIQELYQNPEIRIAISPIGSTLKGYSNEEIDLEYELVILNGLPDSSWMLRDIDALEAKFNINHLIREDEARFPADHQIVEMPILNVSGLLDHSTIKVPFTPHVLTQLRDLFLPMVYGDASLLDTQRALIIRHLIDWGSEGEEMWEQVRAGYRQASYVHANEVADRPHLAQWLKTHHVDNIDSFNRERQINLPDLQTMANLYGLSRAPGSGARTGSSSISPNPNTEPPKRDSDRKKLRPRENEHPLILSSVPVAPVLKLLRNPRATQPLKIVRPKDGPAQITTEAADWPAHDSALEAVEESLDIDILRFIRDRLEAHPERLVTVVDWGAGTGRALHELAEKLIQAGLDKKVRLMGYSNQAYPDWLKTPSGVTFIFDTFDRLPSYLQAGEVDFIFSRFGINHIVVSPTDLATYYNHLELLAPSLHPQGEIRHNEPVELTIDFGKTGSYSVTYTKLKDDTVVTYRLRDKHERPDKGQPPNLKRRRNPVLEVMDWTHEAARDILHRGNRVRFATGPQTPRPAPVSDTPRILEQLRAIQSRWNPIQPDHLVEGFKSLSALGPHLSANGVALRHLATGKTVLMVGVTSSGKSASALRMLEGTLPGTQKGEWQLAAHNWGRMVFVNHRPDRLFYVQRPELQIHPLQSWHVEKKHGALSATVKPAPYFAEQTVFPVDLLVVFRENPEIAAPFVRFAPPDSVARQQLVEALAERLIEQEDILEQFLAMPLEEEARLPMMLVDVTAGLVSPNVFNTMFQTLNQGIHEQLHVPMATPPARSGFHPWSDAPNTEATKRHRNPVLEVMDWTHEAARDILHRGNRVRFATGLHRRAPRTPIPDNPSLISENEWKNIQAVPNDRLKPLLLAVAAATGIPAGFVGEKQLRLPHAFLGGRTLINLYRVFAERAKATGQEPGEFMRQALEIEVTADDIITMMIQDKRFNWKYVPEKAIVGLLNRVADKRRVPVSMLGYSDFVEPLEFLGDRNLESLYQHALERSSENSRTALTQYLNGLGLVPTVSDLIQMASRADRDVPWERASLPVLADFLRAVASNLQLPARNLTEQDLRGAIPLLAGNSLSGLLDFLLRHERKPGSLTVLAFLRNRILPLTKDTLADARRQTARQFLAPYLGSTPRGLTLRAALRHPDATRALTLIDNLVDDLIGIYHPTPEPEPLLREAQMILRDEQRQIWEDKVYFREVAVQRVLTRWMERVCSSFEKNGRVHIKLKVPESKSVWLDKTAQTIAEEYNTVEKNFRFISWITLNGQLLSLSQMEEPILITARDTAIVTLSLPGMSARARSKAAWKRHNPVLEVMGRMQDAAIDPLAQGNPVRFATGASRPNDSPLSFHNHSDLSGYKKRNPQLRALIKELDHTAVKDSRIWDGNRLRKRLFNLTYPFQRHLLQLPLNPNALRLNALVAYLNKIPVAVYAYIEAPQVKRVYGNGIQTMEASQQRGFGSATRLELFRRLADLGYLEMRIGKPLQTQAAIAFHRSLPGQGHYTEGEYTVVPLLQFRSRHRSNRAKALQQAA